MELYRSFIAFQLPKETVDYCLSIKNNIVKNKLDAKWSSSQNWHITVNFMGNKPYNELLTIAENIRNINLNNQQIFFQITKLITLGSQHNILCLQLLDINKTATKIVGNIIYSNKLQADYQIWTPHITLARLQSFKSKQTWQQLKKENLLKLEDSYKFSPESLHVYTSQLKPTGPIYKKIIIEK